MGHNGIAYWAGKFSEGALPHPEALSIAGRPPLYFMELNYGLHRQNYGFSLGLVPLSGIENPVLDIHYYPQNMAELPWLIFNNSAYHGFSSFVKIGDGNLNTRLSVDKNVKQSHKENGVVTQGSDQNTLMLNYDYLHSSGLSATPWLIRTFGGDSSQNPLTLGTNITFPILSGFTVVTSYYYTTQNLEGTLPYSGSKMRLGINGKIGPGVLAGWFDKSMYNPDNGEVYKDSFVWIHYQYSLYKSEAGEVILKPTIRLLQKKEGNEIISSRNKFELTTVMKFR